MKRAELNKWKTYLLSRKEKAADLELLMEKILQLPYGQMKKVLTDDIMAMLEKYGYGE